MTLFVRNISYEVGEPELYSLFSAHGEISRVSIARNKDQTSKGFAFVEVPSDEDALAALQALDQLPVAGRRIHVCISDPTRKRAQGLLRSSLILFAVLLTLGSAEGATYTSTQSGNWSAPSTWGGSGPPGNGDTAVVNHAITVDADTTIGVSGVNGTTAVTLAAQPAAVTIASGKLFRVRGDILISFSYNAGTLYGLVGNAGAIFEWDSSQAASPSATQYNMHTNGIFGGLNNVQFNGTSGNHCTVRSNAGGGNGYFSTVADGTGGAMVATYTDFLRIGDGTKDSFQPTWFLTGAIWDIQHCSFTSCGRINVSAPVASSTIRHKFNQHVLSAGATVMVVSTPTCTAMASGERSFVGNDFDIDWAGSSFSQDYTITDNLFEKGFNISTGCPWASFARNFERMVAGSVTAAPATISDSYILLDSFADLTFHVFDVVGNLDMLRNIYDATYFQIHVLDISDGLLAPGGSSGTFHLTNNILLPAGDGRGGTAIAAPRQDGTAKIFAEHNTVIPATVAFEVVQSGSATDHGTIKNNVFWDTSTRACIVDAGGAGPAVTDFYLASNIANNAQINIKATNSTGSGFTNQAHGYCEAWSSTPGTTDLFVDPQFVDKTRNFATFAASYLKQPTGAAWVTGHSYSAGDIVSDPNGSYFGGAVINYTCTVGHTSGASTEPGVGSSFHSNWEFASLTLIRNAVAAGSTITDSSIGALNDTYITTLVKWVRAGFAPKNQALKGAGSDGLDIGAVPVALPQITSLFNRPSNVTVTITAGTPIALASSSLFVNEVSIQMASGGSGIGYVMDMNGFPAGTVPNHSTSGHLTAQLGAATVTAPGSWYRDHCPDKDPCIDAARVFVDGGNSGDQVIIKVR
jgi:hypothetical protein